MEAFKYKYDDLFNPTLQSLHKLGGSASVPEIEEEVSKILNTSSISNCTTLDKIPVGGNQSGKEVQTNESGRERIH